MVRISLLSTLRAMCMPVALIAGLATCGGDDAPPATIDGGGDPGPDATPAPYCSPEAGTALRLQLITDDLVRPVAMAAPPADPRLFIVEQPGRVRVVKDGLLQSTPFLTVAATYDVGDEQGMLGLAFHPQYATNGRFFVMYAMEGDTTTYQIRVAEYGADPTSDVARTTEQVILDIEDPYDNHNGGTVAFGSDGFLYISLGDGGGANDSLDAGQDPDTRNAKILRVDVDGGDPYAIPPGNPWATSGAGVEEMFAWGLRNPWKITIDPSTGDLWIGDVGQGMYEEINVVRSGTDGQNFGWPVFEGPDCFIDDSGGNAGCNMPQDYVTPVMAYQRVGTGQCSVVAGGVYRGTCMPDLVGQFFFGDYCSGEVRSFPATSNTISFASTTDHTGDVDPDGVLYGRLSSFGVDGYNELYVASLRGGAVYRIEIE